MYKLQVVTRPRFPPFHDFQNNRIIKHHDSITLIHGPRTPSTLCIWSPQILLKPHL